MENISPKNLLLKASLLTSEFAYEYYIRWEKETDFETIDSDTYFLLPAVYKNLRNQIQDSQIFPRIRGVYKKTWLENHLRIQKLEQVFEILNTNSIDFIVLSNTIDVWNQNNDKGILSLEGFEILIKPQDVKEIISALEKVGWNKQKHDFLADLIVLNFQKTFSINFSWHIDIFSKKTWRNTKLSKFDNSEFKTLSSTNQVLYLCRNIESFNRQSFLVYSVLKNDKEFNWNDLISVGKAKNLSGNILPILENIKTLPEIEIPQRIIDDLSRSAKHERTKNKQTFLSAYKSLRRSYLRASLAKNAQTSFSGFLFFLREHWKINSILSLPWQIGKRFYRQIVS